MSPTEKQIAEAAKRFPEGASPLEFARALGGTYTIEKTTPECAAAVRAALDRGIIALGDRLKIVPGLHVDKARSGT